MPALKNAPPSLVHYFGHYCQQHADLEFLIDGDCRLTFAQTWQAARAVAAEFATILTPCSIRAPARRYAP